MGYDIFNTAYGLRASFETRDAAFKYLFAMDFQRCEDFMTRLYRPDDKIEAHVHAVRKDIIHDGDKYFPYQIVYYSERIERLRRINTLPKPAKDTRLYVRDMHKMNVDYAG